jgi:glycosyltransferase involved in cell wall biosynthesis
LDGVTGILVPPSSPEKVAEAVLRLASNPQLRMAYGDEASKLVEDKFTMQHTLDQMEQVFLHTY